jgi:hypothetical protein
MSTLVLVVELDRIKNGGTLNLVIVTGQFPLVLSMVSDDMLSLVFGGDIIYTSNTEKIAAYEAEVLETIKTLKSNSTKPILCLIDITTIHEIDDGALEILKKNAALPELRDIRTAVVIANVFGRMILRIVSLFTSRTNMQSFDSTEKAMFWLRS